MGQLGSIGYARKVRLDGSLAYVAADDQGVIVIDISQLKTPVQFGKTGDDRGRPMTWLGNGRVYAADDYPGLTIAGYAAALATPDRGGDSIAPAILIALSSMWLGQAKRTRHGASNLPRGYPIARCRSATPGICASHDHEQVATDGGVDRASDWRIDRQASHGFDEACSGKHNGSNSEPLWSITWPQ